jgi:carbohydrate diacid regulator
VTITNKIGQQIIDRLSEVQNSPISIMNHTGHIVAATDNTRVGVLHEGAVKAMKEKKDIHIYAKDCDKLNGVIEGVTLPLYSGQACLGAIGIAGDPDQITQNTSLMRIVALSLIEVARIEDLPGYSQRLLDVWINNLTAEHFENFQQMGEQARYLGIDLNQIC